MKKHILAVLAYMIPTFPLGYFWHLKFFADDYKSLHVYRENIIIPFGILSMLIQGVIWSFNYRRTFDIEPALKGAIETGFMLVHYIVVSPLIAAAHAGKSPV